MIQDAMKNTPLASVFFSALRPLGLVTLLDAAPRISRDDVQHSEVQVAAIHSLGLRLEFHNGLHAVPLTHPVERVDGVELFPGSSLRLEMLKSVLEFHDECRPHSVGMPRQNFLDVLWKVT